jgi:sugar phosphate isomerase/epimerase
LRVGEWFFTQPGYFFSQRPEYAVPAIVAFPFFVIYFPLFIYNLLVMINRRTFLQQSSLLTAALMAGPGDLFKKSRVLGIQLYTVRNEVFKNLENSLEQIAASGYSTVELFGYNNRKYFGRSILEMSDLLKKNNLVTPSGHYGLSDMLYGADYNYDSWKYLLEDASILGHKYVVVPFLEPAHRTLEDFKRVSERLNKAGELSKAAGLITGYHNHNFEFASSEGTTFYEYMLRNTQADLVKFEMDLYWVKYAGQDPADWFRRYPGRFPLWHIKDMEAKTEGQAVGQTCEVGKGIINWKEIFTHQKAAGLDFAFVEQEQYRAPVFDCIKTSAAYMKANLL